MALYNADAMKRIEAAYPGVAKGAVKLIQAAEGSNAGSAEIVMRYDKPVDEELGKYEVVLIVQVKERSEP